MDRTHQVETGEQLSAPAGPSAIAHAPLAPVPLPVLRTHAAGKVGHERPPGGLARLASVGQQAQQSEAREKHQRRQVDVTTIRRLSLGGERVHKDKKFAGNAEQIIEHARGEWDNKSGGGVQGGHLLSSMITKWAADSSANVFQGIPDHNSPHGIYFERSIPNHTKVIKNKQFPFRLVGKKKDNEHQTAVSKAKPSTFWPTTWGEDHLRNTFADSFQCGPDSTVFASNANDHYYFLWQTLGDKTAFPIGRAGKVTDTERIGMRDGRKNALGHLRRESAT
jgi:hypothetical protein